jgi:hypothetical protein
VKRFVRRSLNPEVAYIPVRKSAVQIATTHHRWRIIARVHRSTGYSSRSLAPTNLAARRARFRDFTSSALRTPATQTYARKPRPSGEALRMRPIGTIVS